MTKEGSNFRSGFYISLMPFNYICCLFAQRISESRESLVSCIGLLKFLIGFPFHFRLQSLLEWTPKCLWTFTKTCRLLLISNWSETWVYWYLVKFPGGIPLIIIVFLRNTKFSVTSLTLWVGSTTLFMYHSHLRI